MNAKSLFATPWTVAHQAALSMGFSRQEYWSGLPFPLPGDHPDPGTKPSSLMSPAIPGGSFTTSATWEAIHDKYRGRGSGQGQSEQFFGAIMPLWGTDGTQLVEAEQTPRWHQSRLVRGCKCRCLSSAGMLSSTPMLSPKRMDFLHNGSGFQGWEFSGRGKGSS